MKHSLAASLIVALLCFTSWAGNVTKVVAKPKSTGPVITKKTIRGLAMLLGHESFRRRRDAQKRLLSIGRGECTRSDKRIEMRELVLDVLEDFRTHKDPEIAFRTRKIIKALSPSPPDTENLNAERW